MKSRAIFLCGLFAGILLTLLALRQRGVRVYGAAEDRWQRRMNELDGFVKEEIANDNLRKWE